MKKLIYITFTMMLFFTFACEDLVDDINDNPNKLAIEEIDPSLFLKGAMLADVQVQLGHLNRISNMWSGQLVGFQSLYKALYEYNFTAAESEATWEIGYQGALNQLRFIQEVTTDDPIYQGISKVVEAHVMGTLASIFGDIPYTEATQEDIQDPKFDDQAQVFAELQSLLDEAITNLENVEGNPQLEPDIFYGGNPELWIESAWTLKARYYLLTKQYGEAFNAAQNGISTPENSMRYIPVDDNNPDNKNLIFKLLNGARTGDIGTGNSFVMQLLDSGSVNSRNHAKTNEEARKAYLTIEESNASLVGYGGRLEPMPLITYAENQLILAESAARTQGLNEGLDYLNGLRNALEQGEVFEQLSDTLNLLYEPFVAADFASGGIENPDGIAANRAFLREVIEERYISGFGQYIPFNDARRLRKSDQDIAIPIPLNIGSASSFPERFVYANTELNSNSNAPDPAPDIYEVTPVNQ
ncbi:SusD/RagB family nutrient-binding outer membrane lipoprotein [Porifericola rhodea]|uniref:SusD/RagB family nutrient-binding outer membrane lipoprotein n=1 Tax=Porifericola rhodea TaxID=930972 RepID=UPI002666090E|nr:SusD/RagB family nutrient-binding outer membrane lipoprotein [Porifericola rhodea]WKN31072.1 SusD/RagB family nutrient-binding outer membrane lipoprotein [Porifericola rhodea]